MTILEWDSAAEWDSAQSEQNVTHEVYGDLPNDTEVRLGWATNLSGLSHMWPMHDNSGPVKDAVGGNDGTVNGASLNYTPALLGYEVADFDGSDDTINVGQSTALDGTGGHTILAFVQMDSRDTNDIVGKWYTSDSERAYLLMVYDDGSNGGGVRSHVQEGSNVEWVDSTAQIPIDGTWAMVGQRWDGSTLESIIDGQVDGSTSANLNINTPSKDTLIGNRSGGNSGSMIDGRVGPVFFFDTAISDALLGEIYDVVDTALTTNGSLTTGKKTS